MNFAIEYNKVKDFLKDVKSSIAFYPAIITLSFSLSAFIILQFEYTAFTKLIFEQFPSLFISDQYQWHDQHCEKSGFLIAISEQALFRYADKHQLIIRCTAHEGTFLLPGERLYQIGQHVDQEMHEEIASHFHFSEKNQSLNTAFVGLKHITEVALKAMSPGINDPCTAQLAIYNIIQQLALRMQIPEHRMHHNDSGRLVLVIEAFPFEKLLHNIMASLRTYVAHDILVVKQILKGFIYLQQQKSPSGFYAQILEKEKALFIKHAKHSLALEADFQSFTKKV